MQLSRLHTFALLFVGDVSIFLVSVWGALFVRHGMLPHAEVAFLHLTVFSLLIPFWVLVLFLFGAYERARTMSVLSVSSFLVRAQIVNGIIATGFFFVFPVFSLTPKMLLIIYLVMATLFLIMFRVYCVPWLYAYAPVKVLFVGGNKVSHCARALEQKSLVPLVWHEVYPESHDTLIQAVSNINPQSVVCDDALSRTPWIRSFFSSPVFLVRGARAVLFSRVYEEAYERVLLDTYTPFVRMSEELRTHSVYDFSKRVFDCVGALVMLPVGLIVVCLAAGAIYFETGRPVFIVQKRIGLFGKPFSFYKLRSMSSDESGEAAMHGGARVTRVGAFLRRTRIDELPQLWNVLKGDLSFIGPRPELETLAQVYATDIMHYSLRHSVRPGLSGWAQVHHHEHPHHGLNTEATRDKLAYDLYYIHHRSFLLDIEVLCKTLRVLLVERGS